MELNLTSNNRYTSITTLVIYLGLFIAIIYAFKMELTDLRCPSVETDPCYCGIGKSSYFYDGDPSLDDDNETLLRKITISSRYELNSVKWRKSLILSVAASLIFFIFLFSRLPKGVELLISVIIFYLIFYLCMIVYQEVIANPANKQIERSVNILLKRIK